MDKLSLLVSTTNAFVKVYKSEDWSAVLQNEVERLDAPCNSPDFDGDCLRDTFCPLAKECKLIYELEQALYRSRLT